MRCPCATTCAMRASSRIDGSAPTIGRVRLRSSRSDIVTHLPVATNAGSSAEMIDGFPWTAGEDDASGAELRGPVGNERNLFLVRNQEDRSPRCFQRANDADDVVDREHIDPRSRLVE